MRFTQASSRPVRHVGAFGGLAMPDLIPNSLPAPPSPPSPIPSSPGPYPLQNSPPEPTTLSAKTTPGYPPSSPASSIPSPLKPASVTALSSASIPPSAPSVPSPSPNTSPPLPNLSALADYLVITPTQLARFADHYLSYYHLISHPKPTGGLRLLASPKARLKAIQRQLLAGILNPAAHGFCPGRSVLTFVAPHVAQPAILRLDLANFFQSIPNHSPTPLPPSRRPRRCHPPRRRLPAQCTPLNASISPA